MDTRNPPRSFAEAYDRFEGLVLEFEDLQKSVERGSQILPSEAMGLASRLAFDDLKSGKGESWVCLLSESPRELRRACAQLDRMCRSLAVITGTLATQIHRKNLEAA